MKYAAIAATSILAIAGSAQAGLSLSDPGLRTGATTESISARMRLDNDNSPTWKNAIIDDSGNIGGPLNALGANERNPIYDSGLTYNWSMSFTAGSNAISLTVSDSSNTEIESLNSTWFNLEPEEQLVAIRIDGSAPGGGSVSATLDSFDFAGNAGAFNYTYDNDFSASPGSTRQYTDNTEIAWLTQLLDDGETLTINGTFTLNWTGSNSNGQKDERTGIFVRLIAGPAVPAPGAAALLAVAGLAVGRRRK